MKIPAAQISAAIAEMQNAGHSLFQSKGVIVDLTDDQARAVQEFFTAPRPQGSSEPPRDGGDSAPRGAFAHLEEDMRAIAGNAGVSLAATAVNTAWETATHLLSTRSAAEIVQLADHIGAGFTHTDADTRIAGLLGNLGRPQSIAPQLGTGERVPTALALRAAQLQSSDGDTSPVGSSTSS